MLQNFSQTQFDVRVIYKNGLLEIKCLTIIIGLLFYKLKKISFTAIYVIKSGLYNF